MKMNELAEKCVECGQCAAICNFLDQSGKTPAAMAKLGVEVNEAFSCCLCGACEAVCPQRLSPKTMFARRRNTAVKGGELDIQSYRYLFPDRPNNVMSVFRRYHGIDYSDLKFDDGGGTWFFPGCTLLTYSPGLTREICRRLKQDGNCQGLWTDCCGKPLVQMGLAARAETLKDKLHEFAEKRKITRLVTACPGCYYELKQVFAAGGISIQTVYETLDFESLVKPEPLFCTIHDACPDRFEGRFASQVRQALIRCGYSLTEMEHSKERGICCGSGGQLSHFQPELTEELVKLRLAEARLSGADVLAGYCLSCVLKFDVYRSPVPVTHALNLLLKQPEDFRSAKEKAGKMFAGTAGEKLWEEIMTD